MVEVDMDHHTYPILGYFFGGTKRGYDVFP
jgi:hypothetical protein